MSCANCGTDEKGEGISLKACKSCISSNIAILRANGIIGQSTKNRANNVLPSYMMHLSSRTHRLRRTVLFASYQCPMPTKLTNSFSFPPATTSSVPINNFAIAHTELAEKTMDIYYSCCAKSICGGCIHSFGKTGNNEKCPFCNTDDTEVNSDAENIGNIMKRVD
jgi:Zn finger protein HypA/HybF involved in hydrogenase expression